MNILSSKTTFTGYTYDLVSNNGHLAVVENDEVQCFGKKSKVMKYWNEIDGNVDSPPMKHKPHRTEIKFG